MTASFARMATATASTKRNPAAVGGKRGAPVAHLASLDILPLMPVSAQIADYYRLNSPRESYVTYTAGAVDVLEGDVMTVAAVDYRVEAASPWPGDNAYTEIILLRVKGS